MPPRTGTAKKASVTLDGVALAGNGSIAWRFQTGVTPYTAVFSVHTSDWKNGLEKKIGQPVDLVIKDSRENTNTIRELYILHTVASDGPKRTSFVVADRRWKWAYTLVARDYNMPKKTGDRTAKQTVPVENLVSVDEYNYRPYSLNRGERWTPKAAVEDLLEVLEGGEGPGTKAGGKTGKKDNRYIIESFPISEGGEFALQGITLRDQGDIALARLLSYIPGASVWVDGDGFVRVFDGADLDRLDQHFKSLPPSTWDGDKAEFIDRQKIRPARVNVFYQREVEIVLDFFDDYRSQTSADPIHTEAYLDNVIPTVDTETTVTEYDPETKRSTTKTVPPGTYVTVKAWLAAMDKIKPKGSRPWNFDTIAEMWVIGGLDGALGAIGKDLDAEGNVAARVQALKQHFRQTFRLNRRYVERIRDMQAVRVALLDPVTGARAPAGVWGQSCIVPTDKGKLVAPRRKEGGSLVYRNVDTLPGFGDHVIDFPPGPSRVSILDRDLGIFRVEWVAGPYGTVGSYIPCHLVGESNRTSPRVPTRDLALQDTEPMGPGMRVQWGANGLLLRPTMQLKVLLTIVPAAPNNKKQFHAESVKASDIQDLFRSEFRIQEGKGPDLDVYIAPGEVTARFAWVDDVIAPDTVVRLLGLDSDDPQEAGLEDDPETKGVDESKMLGFQIANQGVEIQGHSRAVAAELLAAFADNVQGEIATVMPAQGVRLRGNMQAATIQIQGAPSAKVNVKHNFPGQQKPINRLALLPAAAREIILGTLPFGKGDK